MDSEAHPPDPDARRALVDRLLAAGPGTATPPTRGELLRRLCRAATEQLEVAGACVALMTAEGSLGVIASTDDRTTRVDDAQFSLGEGPGFEAIALRRPVLTSDLTSPEAGRWPAYRAAALEEGLHGVLAFPLHVGAAAFGVLSLHLDRPDRLAGDRLSMALTFAVVATETLLDGADDLDGPAHQEVTSLLDYRAEIYQAQGITMVAADLSLPDALAAMRAHAFASNLTLEVVASRIVSGELSLDGDSP